MTNNDIVIVLLALGAITLSLVNSAYITPIPNDRQYAQPKSYISGVIYHIKSIIPPILLDVVFSSCKFLLKLPVFQGLGTYLDKH